MESNLNALSNPKPILADPQDPQDPQDVKSRD